MKNKTDVFTIIIAIVFLVASGYFAYQKFFAPYEGNSIENVNVDKKCIAQYDQSYRIAYEDVTGVDMSEYTLDNMESSNSSCFEVTLGEKEYQLWQISNEEYVKSVENTLINESSDKFMDKVHDHLMTLFNFSYENIKAPDSRSLTISYVLDKSFDNAALNMTKKLSSYFDGNVDSFFEKNQVVLSCDDVQFTKIAHLNWEEEDYYYVVGTAEVTTVAAKKDISASSILPDAGETRTVNIKVMGNIYELDMPMSESAWLEYIEFE